MVSLIDELKLKAQRSKLKTTAQNSKLLVFWAVFVFWPLFITNSIFAQEKKIAVANDFGQVLFYNLSGQLISSFSLPEGFADQNNLAIGDVDGDFENEIVIMPKSGALQIGIFSENGELKSTVILKSLQATKESFDNTGGFLVPINIGTRNDIAMGDLNDDGKSEIIISAMPYIEIFDFKGKLKEKFAPFSKNFRGEIKIAAGDIDRDRKDEIVFLNNEHTDRIFVYKNKNIFSLPIEFKASNFSIALGDLEGDGKAEFGICSSATNSECQISRFDHKNIQWPNNLIFENILNLKLKDVDDDGRVEALSAKSFGGRINIYKINGNAVLWKTIYTLQNISDIDIFAQKEKIKAKVIYVDDGDTIFLDNGQEIRYIGLDTPEIGEPFYLEAANLNKELIFGREVTIEYDKQKIDPYGRYLAYVFSNGTFINEELLKSGFAKTEFIFPDVKYVGKLSAAEKQAREEKIGLWK